MAEKEIRLPKWDGKEYYPATTTEAVADRERQKGLNEVLSDIEDTIDSYNRANQLMLNQKQDKLRYYTENTSTDTAVIKVSHDTDEATFHEDKVEVGVDNCVFLKSEDLLLGEDSYIKVSPEKVSMSSPQGKIEDAVGALVSNANAIAILNGEGEGSVNKTVTDEIAKVVAGAPADLDTLKEIADYIASDKTNAAEINNTLDRHTSEITSLQNNKQDQLDNYKEVPRGKTTIKYPDGTARVEVSNVRAALWANDDKVAIAADANGTRMLYQKTAEDGSIEHRDEISIGKHDDSSATHITLTSKSTTEEAGEKITTTSTIQVNPDGISMTSPNGEIDDVVKEINDKAPKVGYAPDLKVNFAKELVGRGESTDEVIGGIRPTGVRSIGDGNATIAKIKGESVVWNQHVNMGADITGYGLTFSAYGLGGVRISGTPTQQAGDVRITWKKKPATVGHKILAKSNAQGINIRCQNSNVYNGISTATDTALLDLVVSFNFPTDTAVNLVFYPEIVDLTLMFGAGNEPTTIEEFEARKPLGVSNEYNEGTIVSYNGDALKSVGFNAYNGTYAKVIGGEEYHATGTTSISFAKELDGDATAITLDSEGKFIPTEDGYVYAEGKDIVIHLTHSYTPEHVDEYEEDVHPLPNVKSILDANGNQLFPYGLLSAGSVHDEITATKAIKRIGVVDMGTLTWGNFKNGFTAYSVRPASGSGLMRNLICAQYSTYTPREIYDNDAIAGIAGPQSGYWGGVFLADSKYSTSQEVKQALQGVLLYYELAEPIEVDLPEPLNMTYEAWDFGTEELIADSATTPLNADIVYQFNAVDRIRENSSAIDDLEECVEERKDDGIELLTNGNLKLTLKGETREFMPATPSGDPMHYAYVSAGAEYNDTGEDKVKDAPWAALADTDEEKKVTHKAGCWYLSGVGDMTNDDIRYSYINRTLLYDLNRRASFSSDSALRTIYPVHRGSSVSGLGPTKASTLFQCTKLETCLLSNMQGVRQEHDYSLSLSASYEFYKCTALKAIGQVTPTTTDINRFAHCTSLRYIWIYELKVSLNLKDSSLISKLSVKYMIDNATPTSAITITLHADAYARLAEDADIVAALAAKPLVTLVSA